MKLLKHAEERVQQRGFQEGDVDLIVYYGTPVRKSGNVIEYQMRKKDGKHLIQTADRITGKAVLVCSDRGDVITVYNLHKKR